MAPVTNKFVKGQSTYVCRCCGRTTRQTGGDNHRVQLCTECYDLSGEENHLSDNGTLYESPQNVLAMIGAIRIKGGNASEWKTLENKAREMLGLGPVATGNKEPQEVIVTLKVPGGSDVRTAYPIADKVKALVLVGQYLAETKSFTITYE